MTHAIRPYWQGIPRWQADSDRHLKFAMLLAAILVVSGLSVFRMPVAGDAIPLLELVVRLIQSATETEVDSAAQAESKSSVQRVEKAEESPPTQEEIDQPAPQSPMLQATAENDEPVEIVPVPREAVENETDWFPAFQVRVVDDWREFGAQIVQQFILNLPKAFSVNPVFDEKRRVAVIKFRPSNAPLRRGPWDDVEKDQIGRSILKLGDHCFQVLDDPSVLGREVFESYTQYVVQCTISFAKRRGEELPWVNEVRLRHAYLRRREAQRRDANAF